MTCDFTTDEHGDPALTITLTGGHDLLRFAVNMLDDQCEFSRAGREALAKLRAHLTPERFDPWARSMLGEHRYRRLHDGGYFERGEED